MQPTSQLIQLRNCRLHYLEWGDAEPPIVYIPGFIANAYGAIRLANVASPQHRVLALDLRGRGKSDKPDTGYGIPTHIEDLHEFCQQLNLSRIILMGHSFGAAVTLFFAAQYPDLIEKIVLLDGGVPPSELAFQMFMAYHQNLKYEYPSVEAYLAPYRLMETLQPWTDEAEQLTRANVIEQTDGRALRSVPRHVVESELAALNLGEWQTLTALYQQIQAPVLLIRAGLGSFGREDQHISPDALAKMQTSISNFQVYDMPEAGHTGILTVPDPLRDQVIMKFITN